MANVDPELMAQLESAEPDAIVEAVFRLKPPPGRSAPPADEAQRMGEDIVRTAEIAVHMRVDQMHIMKNIGVLVAAATKPLLKAILEDDRVESAMANRQPTAVVGKLGF